MTDKGLGGMDVELNRLLGAIDTARAYSPNEGDLAIVTLRMDEALALADALRREKARLDFVEQHALFIALDGRAFSHCQMGASRSCVDAAIAAMTPNEPAQGRSREAAESRGAPCSASAPGANGDKHERD